MMWLCPSSISGDSERVNPTPVVLTSTVSAQIFLCSPMSTSMDLKMIGRSVFGILSKDL
jgi:hypothetical protein